MTNYELTERGKIIIAVVLVILLLVIPAVIIFGISSCNGSDDPSARLPIQTPDIEDLLSISEAQPPDNGDDSDSSETPGSDDTKPDAEPTPEPTTPPDEGDSIEGGASANYGPVGLNLSEGTMSFIFSPDEQDALDDDTIDMIKEFLSSPMNERGTQIKVEMPHVDDDDEEAIISAVTRAFSRHNVSGSILVFAMTSTVAEGRYFEVDLSFIEPAPSSK